MIVIIHSALFQSTTTGDYAQYILYSAHSPRLSHKGTLVVCLGCTPLLQNGAHRRKDHCASQGRTLMRTINERTKKGNSVATRIEVMEAVGLHNRFFAQGQESCYTILSILRKALICHRNALFLHLARIPLCKTTYHYIPIYPFCQVYFKVKKSGSELHGYVTLPAGNILKNYFFLFPPLLQRFFPDLLVRIFGYFRLGANVASFLSWDWLRIAADSLFGASALLRTTSTGTSPQRDARF